MDLRIDWEARPAAGLPLDEITGWGWANAIGTNAIPVLVAATILFVEFTAFEVIAVASLAIILLRMSESRDMERMGSMMDLFMSLNEREELARLIAHPETAPDYVQALRPDPTTEAEYGHFLRTVLLIEMVSRGLTAITVAAGIALVLLS